MTEQLQLSTATAFFVQDIFIWTHVVHKQQSKPLNESQECYSIYKNLNSGCGGDGDFWLTLSKLFPAIHSLYVVNIVVLQFLPLQLERIRNQTCLGRPRLWTKMHLHWNLKSLKFNCVGEK